MRSHTLKAIQPTGWQIFRTEIDKIIVLTILFNFLLVAARVVWSGEWTFIFMPWNLFLSVVPYTLSKWLSQSPKHIENKFRFTIFFAVWLVFIPNSFYIITDLFHLVQRSRVPLWYDLILLMSFVWSGLVMGILSVRHMEKAVRYYRRGRSELIFIYPVMALNAFGVYIGRYLRYNTWDIICNPVSLMIDISNMIFHPLRSANAWGMIFFFSVLMTLIYLTIKRVSKSLG